MKVDGKSYRTIWVKGNDPHVIQIIDQRFLPHRFVVEDLSSSEDMIRAIKDMHVRGAPLIGVAASFGMYLAALEAASRGNFEDHIHRASQKLLSTRPTAVNLKFGLNRSLEILLRPVSVQERIRRSLLVAEQLADEDARNCELMGEHGLKVITELHRKKGSTVNILTHCNAGWLACVDWGTATAPMYKAYNAGVDIHVWVDETRPRLQGANLTAWELGQHQIPHTVSVDGQAGHLLQRGRVDMIIVGTDRTTATGDVANKIGTYPLALAAKDNHVPFYAAVPSSSIDWDLSDGIKEIPIEERSEEEVTHVLGSCDGEIKKVRLTPEKSRAVNFAFDVTPSRLITGLITEHGIVRANDELRSQVPVRCSERND